MKFNLFYNVARSSGPVALLLSSSVLALAMPATVQAQVGTGPAAAASAEGQPEATDQLAEITVTAQRRSQNVQALPITVNAISESSLKAAGVTNVASLPAIDTGLQISTAPGVLLTFMRGIGNLASGAGNEASVPVYLDDVYYVRAAPALFDLANVSRVEVLRGPQGTLFGRNASAGAIAIYTKDPGQTVEVNGLLGYGNFETVRGQLYAGGPLSSNLATDISISGLNQSGGWGRNVVTGAPTNRQRYISVRSKTVWHPTDSTTVRLVGYYSNAYSELGAYQRCYPGTICGTPNWERQTPGIVIPTPANYGTPRPIQALGFYDVQSNFSQHDESEGYGGSLRIDQELGFADIVSITAGRKAKATYFADSEISSFDYVDYDLHYRDSQVSEEVQLKSKPGTKLTWLLGLYYLNAKQGYNPATLHGDYYTALGLNKIELTGLQDSNSYAVFGQATYPILEKTNLTVGLRYTWDEVIGFGKTVVYPTGLGFGVEDPTGRFDQTTRPNDYRSKSQKLTWRVALDHKITPDVLIYASASRGFKAGTFNTLPINTAALRPEVVDAYEVGIKSELFDRRLRINVAAFRSDIKDLQVQAAAGNVPILINAKAARSQGFEMDASALLAPGLTARVSGTYLDAKYLDFANAPGYRYDVPGDLGCVTAPTCGAFILQQINASGNRLPFASPLRFNAGLNYARDVTSIGSVVLDANVDYTGSFYWEADNAHVQSRYALVNGSIAVTPAGLDSVTFRVWVKNLTDKKYNMTFLSEGSQTAAASAPAAPRTYGAEVSFHF